MEDFSKYKIKDYTHWSISLNSNQSYLGRCVVWCNREDALDLTDATEDEQRELFIVLKELEKALEKTFKSDLLNFAFLGNATHHLHGHVVPRYAAEREFKGITFKDERWGDNFKTDPDFSISDEVIEKLKLTLQKALS